MITVVGDNSTALADYAKSLNATAGLCDFKNYKNIINKLPSAVYTGIRDLNLDQLKTILDLSTEIFYQRGELTDEEHLLVTAWLKYFSHTKPVHNLSAIPTKSLELIDSRKSENSQLWIVGCSISAGICVDPKDRWGQLAANELELPVSFLAVRSSSFEWAADQILRSDIRCNDIVLWQLHGGSRFLYYTKSGDPIHVSSGHYQQDPTFNKVINERNLLDLNHAYKNVNYVYQVKNYLDQIGCQYRVGLLLPLAKQHEGVTLNALYNVKEFFVGYNHDFGDFNEKNKLGLNFIDHGTDGIHPGPEQHKIYARQFIESLKE
jgi:hypothetical protein